MRTIKFNGKCLSPEKGKEMAYGSLLTFQSPDGTAQIFEYDHGNVFHYFTVAPDTVGQFTGFHDKNGKEIYEGDVLRSDEYPFSCAQYGTRDNYFGVVFYSKEEASFFLKVVKNPESGVELITDGVSDYIRQGELMAFEIVGNIHEEEWEQYGKSFQKA